MTVESAVRLYLTQQGPCTLESLLVRLSQFSWSEIFGVVDRLSREGRLVLRRADRFGYEVSIEPNGVVAPSAKSAFGDEAQQENTKPTRL